MSNAGDALSLGTGGSLVTDSGDGSGTIAIAATPNTGTWTLTGPSGFVTVTGTGDYSQASVPAGTYYLSPNALTGYTIPPATGGLLEDGETLTLTATWASNAQDSCQVTIDPIHTAAGIRRIGTKAQPSYDAARQFTAKLIRFTPAGTYQYGPYAFNAEETGFFLIPAGRKQFYARGVDRIDREVKAGSRITWDGDAYIVTRVYSRKDIAGKSLHLTCFVSGSND